MIYVALLRGINVGGNAKVEMSRLKQVFESLGLESVKTYINSGNVIFTAPEHTTHLTDKIEHAIEKEFKLDVKVTLRTLSEMQKINAVIPHDWSNDNDKKTDILFLWDDVNRKDILQELIIKPNIDHVKYIDGAIIWHIDRKDVTRSGLLKIVGTELYKKITVRNVNTLRKLVELMKAAEH